MDIMTLTQNYKLFFTCSMGNILEVHITSVVCKLELHSIFNVILADYLDTACYCILLFLSVLLFYYFIIFFVCDISPLPGGDISFEI